jgi:hypothetical protein
VPPKSSCGKFKPSGVPGRGRKVIKLTQENEATFDAPNVAPSTRQALTDGQQIAQSSIRVGDVIPL